MKVGELVDNLKELDPNLEIFVYNYLERDNQAKILSISPLQWYLANAKNSDWKGVHQDDIDESFTIDGQKPIFGKHYFIDVDLSGQKRRIV